MRITVPKSTVATSNPVWVALAMSLLTFNAVALHPTIADAQEYTGLPREHGGGILNGTHSSYTGLQRLPRLSLPLDKKTHIAVSYAATVSGALILQKLDVPTWLSITIAGLATLAAGTVKEVLFDDEFSWADQGANAIGVGAGAAFIFVLEL